MIPKGESFIETIPKAEKKNSLLKSNHHEKLPEIPSS
jgi:hypothetical protein